MGSRILAVALGLLIGFPTWLHAVTTWYVDNTNGVGDDTYNNGTSIYTPFKTIQKAANMVSSGDTVYVRATSTPYAKFVMYDNNVRGQDSNL
jgi:hypothetical protein